MFVARRPRSAQPDEEPLSTPPNAPRPPDQPAPSGAPPTPPVRGPRTGTALDGRSLQQRLRLFLLVLLGLVVVVQLELPFRLAGILLALPAGWLGIRLVVGMARIKPNPLSARGWVIVLGGLGLAGVLMLSLLTQAVYYPVISDQEKCLSGANTRTAQQLCNDTADRRLEELMRRLSGVPATP